MVMDEERGGARSDGLLNVWENKLVMCVEEIPKAEVVGVGVVLETLWKDLRRIRSLTRTELTVCVMQ